jgi:hypothetical protein
MWQQQEAGNKLANIIQKLQARRETGQLTVKHGRGLGTEEGTIVFENGKIVEARIGRRVGSEVFNRMSRWENCSCRFARFIDISAETPETSPDFYTEMSPSLYTDPSLSKTTPLNQLQGTTTGSLNSVNPNSDSLPFDPIVPYPALRHLEALQKIEQLGLSRAHRRLFLLIDGQRPLSDLIRLMNKPHDEVYQLLQDLELGAVVRIMHKPPPPTNQV